MKEKLACALLFGEAKTDDKAEKIAISYRNCPYIHLMATKKKIDRSIDHRSTFFLPEKQRWWIEYVEKSPKTTFGLERAKVTFVDQVQHPQHRSMRLPEIAQESSPCGANCRTCSANDRCLCCPATIFYKYPSI